MLTGLVACEAGPRPSASGQVSAPMLPPLAEPAAPRRGRGRRWLRLVFGVGLLAFAGWVLTPLIFDIRSTHAVINAPVITVRSPIDGTVTFLDRSTLGAAMKTQYPLLEVDNPLADDGRLDGLRDEQAVLAARVAGEHQQLAALEELSGQLATSASKYQAARLRDLEQECAEAKAAAAAARALEKQRQCDKTLVGHAYVRSSASTQEAVTAELAAEAAGHSAAQAQRHVERLQSEIEALRSGVHVSSGDGRNDVPYSTQRLHELALRREELRAALRQDEAKLARLERHLHAEEERQGRQAHFTTAPLSEGILWRRHVTTGGAVKAGSSLVDLVDPQELLVDAVIEEKHLESIHPGAEARVRLDDSGVELPAVVRQIAGRSLPWPDHLLAVAAVPAEKQEVHIILALGPLPQAGSDPGAIPVGRPVEVIFRSSHETLRRLLGGLLP
jgi:hypothetical protein